MEAVAGSCRYFLDTQYSSFLKYDILETIHLAGVEIQQQYCSGRSEPGSGPIMLPPVPQQNLIDVFSELDLTNENRIKQVMQCGADIEVYRALENIDNDKMLVLSGFQYTHEQFQRVIGEHECDIELPHEIEGKCDFVVLLQLRFWLIVVILDVKAPQPSGNDANTEFDRSLSESLKERDTTRLLVETIFNMTENDRGLKILDFSIFSHMEKTMAESFRAYQCKSFDEKTKIVFKDDMDDFAGWWEDKIVSQLGDELGFKSGFEFDVPFSKPSLYSNLNSILIGLWCMDDKNNCNTEKCSLVHLIEKIDKSLRKAQSVITRRPKGPVIKVEPDIFKRYLNIECITKAQKSIFNATETCLFICGPAGSGKTILLLAKILDLVLTCETDRQIVLITSGERSARYCESVLVDALGSVVSLDEVILGTQEPEEQLLQWIVMEKVVKNMNKITILWRKSDYLDGRFNLLSDLVLRLADIGYHVFADDLQDRLNSLSVILEKQMLFLDSCSGVFGKGSPPPAETCDRVVWVTCDVAQHSYSKSTKQKSIGLATFKEFEKIPIDSIKYLLCNQRSTADISNVLAVIREHIITKSELEIRTTAPQHGQKIAPLQRPGQRIRGPKPHLYLLTRHPKYNPENHIVQGIVRNIINSELDILYETSTVLQYNNTALLYSGGSGWCAPRNWRTFLEHVLEQRAGSSSLLTAPAQRAGSSLPTAPTQRAGSSSLLTAPTQDVRNLKIFDMQDTSSAEWQAVIAVVDDLGTYFPCALYKALSRAKVYCSIIILDHRSIEVSLSKKLEPLVNITYLNLDQC